MSSFKLCVMEVMRRRLATSTENNVKNPFCNLNAHLTRCEVSSPPPMIVVGGGFRGIRSLITSEKFVGKLGIAEIGDRHGVLSKRGQLGFVNAQLGFVYCSSTFENLNVDAKTPLTSSSYSSREFMSHDGVTCSSVSASTHGPRLPLLAEELEEAIEKAIFNCRFLTLIAVAGSLAGSVLCFLKGCTFVFDSFKEYFRSWFYGYGPQQVSLMLVEAIDVFLMGTVMLLFGLGLYELFVSNLQVPDPTCAPQASRANASTSNFFGLFALQERPKWSEIQSIDAMKTKLGHVIIMVLLVGMFEKSNKVKINSGLDLVFFTGSVLFSSGCLFVLSKLNSRK